MNVGDKVRMLTQSGEGVISRIIDERTVEVEIEDGFQIPVLKREVVVVSKSEAKYFGEGGAQPIGKSNESASTQAARGQAYTKTTKSKNRAVLAAKGIYLAFIPLNDQNLAVYLVNNTDYALPYSIAEEKVNDLYGMDAGVIQGGSFQKLKERSLVNFDKWPDLVIQWLYHRHGVFTMKAPVAKRFKAKASTFYRNKRTAPLLDQEAYLFQIDQDLAVKEVEAGQVKEVKEVKEVKAPEPKVIQAAQIKEAMLSPKGDAKPAGKKKAPKGGAERVVDLHIEKLTNDADFMSNDEIVSLQLKTFQMELDQAIAQGIDHITFIHGVGAGVLRAKIQKQLSSQEHIQYFEDAMKEKFGYGATRVQIK